ncbi:hypothetical protein BT63DRAFT_184922 [Microthyrium microscopicum]|uniref:Uncharacterized protein n=1 Tax=Microthyrium microscopicum TaxID=703497 RepID=A0A6A6UM32_9PEZI|nr:hypothetical protein BT63DRAFT_184922 [Microthyrium microscopicum]
MFLTSSSSFGPFLATGLYALSTTQTPAPTSTSVVSVFFPGPRTSCTATPTYTASLYSADSTAAVYNITDTTNANLDCWPHQVDVAIRDKSTYELTAGYGLSTEYATCTVAPSSTANCTFSTVYFTQAPMEPTSTTVMRTTYAQSEYTFVPVTVTAGLEQFNLSTSVISTVSTAKPTTNGASDRLMKPGLILGALALFVVIWL